MLVGQPAHSAYDIKYIMASTSPAYQVLPVAATSTGHSIISHIQIRGDDQAALETSSLTNSTGTTLHNLLTSGDEPSFVDTDYALTKTMSSLSGLVLTGSNYQKTGWLNQKSKMENISSTNGM